jgi:hypothetical protein
MYHALSEPSNGTIPGPAEAAKNTKSVVVPDARGSTRFARLPIFEDPHDRERFLAIQMPLRFYPFSRLT